MYGTLQFALPILQLALLAGKLLQSVRHNFLPIHFIEDEQQSEHDFHVQ